jgi:hypothetical protein
MYGALRARDAPYIAYERGDVRGALEGLTRKAEDGDGFAAYLVGRAHHDNAIEGFGIGSAAAWYLAAARAGEIRAVASFLDIVITHDPDAVACGQVIGLLELASRAGDLGATLAAGNSYRYGRCVAKDLVRAASYYAGAARLDRRFRPLQEQVQAVLSPEDLARVKTLPSALDLDTRQVLARFVNEAPALLPDSLR